MFSISLISSGNVSCTKTVGVYQVTTAIQRYHLTDLNGNNIEKQPYSELVDLTEDDAKIVPGTPENKGRKIKFAFIDTPGLDDSDGNDMEIMANIVGRVGELDHLNAVVYVRNINRPFGSSFTRFFDYIQRSMPTLCAGLIIVHSGFTVEKVEEFLSRKKDLAKLRKEGFKTATKSNLDLSHFFMDNDPDQSSPFAILQSMNECFRLLNLLALQKPLPTAALKLLKTPNMFNVDVHILYALQRTHTKLKNSWEAEVASANKARANTLKVSREIERLSSVLEGHKQKLQELQSGYSINLGTRTESAEYNFFKTFLVRGDLWVDDRVVEFDASCNISSVEKSATGGCKWVNERLRDTTWRATLQANIFRSINGSATFYTTSQLKYAREIEILKATIADMTRSREFHAEALRETQEDVVKGADAKVLLMGKHVERCATLMETVKKETFDMLLWPRLQRFYVSEKALIRDDVYEFVKVYDLELAGLL